MDLKKISELNPRETNVNCEGVIVELGDRKTFNKYGKELMLANAVLEDSSGNIKLTLWNEDAKKYKEGDRVRVLNGYVSEFQGEKQLTSGKFGKIEKVGSGDDSELSSDDANEVLSEEDSVPEKKDKLMEEQTPDSIPEEIEEELDRKNNSDTEEFDDY